MRGWSTDGEGRASVFSHMIATSHPGDGDTPERFAAAIGEAKIGDRRLRELACYAPQWAAHVEVTLGVRRPRRRRVVAARAHQGRPLDASRPSSRPSGSARSATARSCRRSSSWTARSTSAGSRRSASGSATRTSTALLGAAKYGSTAGGHKRAELFAARCAAISTTASCSSASRPSGTRTRCGARPAAAARGGRARASGRWPGRYKVLQVFRRESPQFGKQRQGSEGRRDRDRPARTWPAPPATPTRRG